MTERPYWAIRREPFCALRTASCHVSPLVFCDLSHAASSGVPSSNACEPKVPPDAPACGPAWGSVELREAFDAALTDQAAGSSSKPPMLSARPERSGSFVNDSAASVASPAMATASVHGRSQP